ncbi:glucose-6-phosphate isomerase [Helicobacter sp. MIT 05-5293]|uniref:glucose-6-phosphate isomerase n=1 Tax=Helicobacter sp. MIT 05-5293 TaxID=1548149 RepID=UPI00051DC4A0|nr:glucose-6-phosphate isomerase [Helicobacter sp. MIT 05-5293]TLD81863.1 glucose-6-phosphate isomerase [Helicobacter sp. MIT 05-5293]
MIEFKLHFDKELLDSLTSFQDALFEGIYQEKLSQKSGYYHLPFEQNAIEETADYLKYHQDFLSNISHLIIVGIGGSSLGLKAIDSLLKHLPARKAMQVIFLEHTDPIYTTCALQNIDMQKSLFIVISKSGTTIETSSLLKFILQKYDLLRNETSKKHLLIITDQDSPLENWATSENLTHFKLCPNIGGRFSILSIVGILPLGILGFDTKALLHGAKNMMQGFFKRSEDHILQKALVFASRKNQTPINVLFSYSSLFQDFNAWYVQLWGESLGKINTKGEKTGLTPIALIGSIDQHSFLQLIVQGIMDKSVTFLGINPTYSREPRIPNISLKYLEATDFVNGQGFSTLLNKQQLATMQTIQYEGIMTDEISITHLCEESVGMLIAYFELLTSCVGHLFEINTYDQPAVEFGKQRLKKLL